MILGVVVVAIWVFLLTARGGFWRMRVEPAPRRSGPAPKVTAVIPARNEADVVGAAVGSLAKQRYAGIFRIVVVDDHSEDGTAEAARVAAGDEVLTVVGTPPLERGWTGKLWAVQTGV